MNVKFESEWTSEGKKQQQNNNKKNQKQPMGNKFFLCHFSVFAFNFNSYKEIKQSL